MMKRVLVGLFVSVAGLVGCAGVGGQIMKQYIGQHMTVGIDKDISFPAEMTFEGLESTRAGSTTGLLGELYGQLTGVTLNQKLTEKLAGNTQPYGEALTEAFRKELREQKVFGAVVDEGGDVALKLKVERFGLAVVDGDASEIRPILEVSASLVVPMVGTVWQQSMNVPSYSTQVLRFALRNVLENSVVYRDSFKTGAQLLATEMVKGMR